MNPWFDIQTVILEANRQLRHIEDQRKSAQKASQEASKQAARFGAEAGKQVAELSQPQTLFGPGLERRPVEILVE
jgi:hypothetical protein